MIPPAERAALEQIERSGALAGGLTRQGGSGPGGRVRPHAVLGRILLHACNLVIAAGALAAYEHFRLEGSSGAALVSLLAAGGFAFAPIRALLHSVFALERGILHVVHGVGGLALVGLTAGGAISGQPVLSHAALAPFAMMGAAQALMHSDHPRNARQAAALRRFVTSMPELEQIARAENLSSPANAARAAAALSDIIGKARALGETELESDPGFQSALRRVTARTGLTLGLDAVDQAIGRLEASPAAARQVPALRRQLAAARRTLTAP
jgi:hypothetical protein